MSRNYVATVFAPEGEDLRLMDCESWPDYVTYVVYQRELAPDTGREHFQVYLELSAKKSIVQLKDDIAEFDDAWLKARKGSQKQARAYSMKEDSRIEGPWEHGTPKAQGQRTDLEAVKTDLDKGFSMKRIYDEHFVECCKYRNFFITYKRARTPKRDWPMEIYIVIGPSGCGKTKFARDSFPDAYWKPHGQWWDDYDGEDCVVVDEMYGNRFSFTELLNLMDRYPHKVPIKGGFVEFSSKTLVFTTNQEPEDWYDAQRTHQHMAWPQNPLNRRIEEFATVVRMQGLIPRPPQLVILPGAIDGQPRLGAGVAPPAQ